MMSAPDPLCTGVIDSRGRLTLDRPIDYGRHLMALAAELGVVVEDVA